MKIKQEFIFKKNSKDCRKKKCFFLRVLQQVGFTGCIQLQTKLTIQSHLITEIT